MNEGIFHHEGAKGTKSRKVRFAAPNGYFPFGGGAGGADGRSPGCLSFVPTHGGGRWVSLWGWLLHPRCSLLDEPDELDALSDITCLSVVEREGQTDR